MLEIPDTRYAVVNGSSIAYQVFGEGPSDLVFAPGFASHLDLHWTVPSYANFCERLASFARVIIFDKRGTGLSDPTDGAMEFDRRIEDIAAVMDAAGSERAVLFGISEGGPLATLFAATYPQRVERLILYGTFARGASLGDVLIRFTDAVNHWGEGRTALIFSPAQAESRIRNQLAGLFERASASPAMAQALLESIERVDVNPILPSLGMPCLVLHRADDPFAAVEWGKQIAASIPDASLVIVAGSEHIPWFGDFDALLDEVEQFVVGRRRHRVDDRMLGTVLFTDIVNSTTTAGKLGDSGWRQLLGSHNEVSRRQFEHYGGREVKTTGDGFLVTFSSPARAIDCARAMIRALTPLGIEIRAGLHTGELELLADGDVGGMAVHMASRVMGLAGGGEVLVSGTVKDLVMGSGFHFSPRGSHQLKGIPGEWPVWEVVERADLVPAEQLARPQLGASDRVSLYLAKRAPKAIARLASLASRTA
jgi:class 3 adenylate cyclase/pimeloyl-ACP methyl ester carboxylesterase